MPLTVALHCSRVKKPQLVPPPNLPPEYWAHHRVLSQGKRYSRPRRCQYPSSPKEYCAEAMPVPKRDAPANTINASFFILASHGGTERGCPNAYASIAVQLTFALIFERDLYF